MSLFLTGELHKKIYDLRKLYRTLTYLFAFYFINSWKIIDFEIIRHANQTMNFFLLFAALGGFYLVGNGLKWLRLSTPSLTQCASQVNMLEDGRLV